MRVFERCSFRSLKLRTFASLLVFFVFGLSAACLNAAILLVNPGSGTLNVSRWEGSSPVNPKADDIESITGTSLELTELYKADVGAPSDTGPFASSYLTTYLNSPSDPQDADFEYVGGMVMNANYALLKGGRAQDPVWYVYNLQATDVGPWNGTDKIEFRGFWPQQNAISHIAFYGVLDSGIPEPVSLMIWGMGAAGLVLAGRRRPA